MAPVSSIARMFSARRISAAGFLLGFLGLGGLSGCLYDSSDRCDPGQTFNADAGLCVCSGNTVAGDHGCEPCGENEIAKDDVCACIDGYELVGSACQFKPLAQGIACEDDAGCTDKVYSTCHVPEGKGGYCTDTGCADTADCKGGYACNTSATPTFCEQPPTGQGMHCAKNADCAGTEATYCENHNTFMCFVEGCSLTENDCFTGYQCCDLAALSSGIIQKKICVKSGTCGQ